MRQIISIYFLIIVATAFQSSYCLIINTKVPQSPFGIQKDICFNGFKLSVNGYPGTPFEVIPFQDVFKNPTDAIPSTRSCRSDGHCIIGYNFDVYEKQIPAFNNAIPSCKKFSPTWFLTYGGTIPGPTITHSAGHESFVRYNNKIAGLFFPTVGLSPCNTNGRKGRPISVHFHGAAAVSPFDGWADDETCTGETKDYVYPNEDPKTGWHHDHAVHITMENAYWGLAAFSIISDKKKNGGCGKRQNIIHNQLFIILFRCSLQFREY